MYLLAFALSIAALVLAVIANILAIYSYMQRRAEAKASKETQGIQTSAETIRDDADAGETPAL